MIHLAKGTWAPAVKAAALNPLGMEDLLWEGWNYAKNGCGIDQGIGYDDGRFPAPPSAKSEKTWAANRYGVFGSGGAGGGGGGAAPPAKPQKPAMDADGVATNIAGVRDASGGKQAPLDGSESGRVDGGMYCPSKSENANYRNGGFPPRDPNILSREQAATHIEKLEASRGEALGKGLAPPAVNATQGTDREIQAHAMKHMSQNDLEAASAVKAPQWSARSGPAGAYAAQLRKPTIPDSAGAKFKTPPDFKENQQRSMIRSSQSTAEFETRNGIGKPYASGYEAGRGGADAGVAQLTKALDSQGYKYDVTTAVAMKKSNGAYRQTHAGDRIEEHTVVIRNTDGTPGFAARFPYPTVNPKPPAALAAQGYDQFGSATSGRRAPVTGSESAAAITPDYTNGRASGATAAPFDRSPYIRDGVPDGRSNDPGTDDYGNYTS